MVIPDHVAKRAAENYVTDDHGCQLSTYSIGSHGYPQIGWNLAGSRRTTTAHRAAWVNARGQIAEGMTVDHICKNRRCVNVDHLRLLTNFENARRTNGRDWKLGECVNGHLNEFLKTEPSGKRKCMKCNLIHQANYRMRRKVKA